MVVIILAAGKGTRMKSDKAKVLHEIMGRPMLDYVIETARGIGPRNIYVVVGFQGDRVREFVSGKGVGCITQEEQLGTGHAVSCAEAELREHDGDLLILSGDVPFLRAETLEKLRERHVSSGADLTILTAKVDDPAHYGRIIRDEESWVRRIVEEKDASSNERLIKEINSGIYVGKADLVFRALKEIKTDNVQGEYYLTDAIEIMSRGGFKIAGLTAEKAAEVMGINSRAELADAAVLKRVEINRRLMLSGVTIIDPANTYVEASVKIGRDSIIYPYTILRGRTEIEDGCIIYSFSQVEDSIIRQGSRIGPFAWLKEGKLLEFIKNTGTGR